MSFAGIHQGTHNLDNKFGSARDVIEGRMLEIRKAMHRHDSPALVRWRLKNGSSSIVLFTGSHATGGEQVDVDIDIGIFLIATNIIEGAAMHSGTVGTIELAKPWANNVT
jgi:hypothetical protein